VALAAGIFFVLVGLVGLGFGLYAMLWGGRDQSGGIGPLSERGIHVLAGIRMFLIGLVSLVGGLYLLLS
jgi:hypothetical protein